jgi:hypothetical protein
MVSKLLSASMTMAVLTLGACASEEPEETDGPASSDGPQPAPNEYMCSLACKNLASCRDRIKPALNQPACSAQCVKELAGTGYLAADVAGVVFEELAKSTLPNCSRMNTQFGWGFRVFPFKGDGPSYQKLASYDAIRACTERLTSMCGDPILYTPDQLIVCLTGVYRYQPAVVERLEACENAPFQGDQKNQCLAIGLCRQAIYDETPGQPWFGPDVTERVDR